MQIILSNSADKFLDKQERGDFNGIAKVRLFLDQLKTAPNPTSLPNCKKMQGEKNHWRWRVGEYRIIAEVKTNECIIKVIKISTRQSAY